jgi:hypothetical protein
MVVFEIRAAMRAPIEADAPRESEVFTESARRPWPSS